MKNNMKNILKKELRELFRDRKSLMMMLIIPVFIPLLIIGMSALFEMQISKDIDEYKRVSGIYVKTKLFNTNDNNLELNGKTYGSNNYNYGLNSKKPYLELKSTNYKVGSYVKVVNGDKIGQVFQVARLSDTYFFLEVINANGQLDTLSSNEVVIANQEEAMEYERKRHEEDNDGFSHQ